MTNAKGREQVVPCLEQLLERLSRLVTASPRLAHEFRFIVGSIWALRQASSSHKDRASYKAPADQAKHIHELNEVMHAFLKGTQPPTKWTSGFYYNAAIMRIAACEGRLRKKLGKANMYSTIKPTPLESVVREVDNLKHHLFGQRTNVSFREDTDDVRNATAALDQLLAILENQEYRSKLCPDHKKLPPP